jgi:hypothetical protein
MGGGERDDGSKRSITVLQPLSQTSRSYLLYFKCIKNVVEYLQDMKEIISVLTPFMHFNLESQCPFLRHTRAAWAALRVMGSHAVCICRMFQFHWLPALFPNWCTAHKETFWLENWAWRDSFERSRHRLGGNPITHLRNVGWKQLAKLLWTLWQLKNAVFWDVAPCGFIINRRFEGTCRLHLQGRRNNASDEKC